MPNLFRHPTSKICYFSRGILKQVQDDKLKFSERDFAVFGKGGVEVEVIIIVMPNLFRHPTSKVCYFSRGILKQVQDDKLKFPERDFAVFGQGGVEVMLHTGPLQLERE